MRRTHVLPLAALLVLAACDGLSGPKVGPPAEISISPIPSGLVVGATVPTITATVRDGEGRPVGGASVTWSASHGTVAGGSTTDGDGLATANWTVGTVAGTQSITVRTGDIQASRSVVIEPGPVTRLVVTPGSVTLQSVGDTVMLAATGEDEHGNQVWPPSIDWSSSEPGVASVQGGRVISHGQGAAVITATSGGVVGTATVAVEQVLIGLRVTPAEEVMAIGETLPLSAQAVDARGSAIDTTFAVSWESSNTAVATVTQQGAVSAIAAGTTVITAVGGGYSAAATIQVSSAARPTITSVSPAVLLPGDTATIRGTNFSATPSENQVTVGGVAAQTVTATATELRVAMPAAGVFPCGPTGDMPVVVTVDGLQAATEHQVAGATQRAMAVGESLSLQSGNVACTELTSGGTYVVSVFNTGTTPGSPTGFLLRGSAPTIAGDAAALPQRVADPPRPTPVPDPEAAAHLWMLEQNIRTARELAARVTPRRTPADQMAVAASPVGTTRTFRIPDLDSGGNLCTAFNTITAKVVYSGEDAVIWEDDTAPLAGQMDARWQQVGREYENIMHPIIREYFGDPLAYDAFIANSGRVNMLFSKQVNDFTRGVLGFVFSGDFHPTGSCGSSNEMALFYGRVPTTSASGYSAPWTVDDWAWRMRSTIIHEVKHIVSFATRMRIAADNFRSPVFESVWLEESTARLAEEFYARALSGHTQGGNVGYQESIWCERRVGDNHPQCDPIPNMMYKHFAAVYSYYRNVENLSPLGQASAGDATFYGSGWLLVRWAMDHSNLSEAAFSKALVSEPTLTGVNNLAMRAGRSFPAMLADFTLAMMVDEYPGGLDARPELRFPSWNTRDIMNGLHEDHQGTGLAQAYPLPWPLAARSVTFGNFDAAVTGIRGGTAAFFQLTGPPAGRQLLELLSSGGTTAPSGLGMAIVRVN
jgi:hypothetical protein